MLQKLTFFMVILTLLSGCQSIIPQMRDCSDKLSANIDGSRVDLNIPDTEQTVTARFNGVTATCYERANATQMQIKIGLKLSRDSNQLSEPLVVELPILIAELDGSDSVDRYQSVSYVMAFPENEDIIYPVVNSEATLALQGRVVLSLIPRLIKP